MHFCKTLKKDTVVSSRVKKDTKNQLFSCRCICGACSPLLLSASSYCHYRSQHRPGQWLCQKACLALRHISELPPPNRITPLNPRLAAPSSPVDTEKRAQKQLHSEKTAVAAFQETELWHEDMEEANPPPPINWQTAVINNQ